MKILMAVLSLVAIPTVTLAQAPRTSVPGAWRLVEEARIDGDAAEFGEIRGIVATPAGKIFVLDYKLHELKLFDAKGKFLKRVARDGAGPGEIRDANGLRLGINGEVWVNDPDNSRFSVYSAEGAFVRQVQVPITSFGYLWEGVVDDNGRVIDPIAKYDAANKRYVRGFARRIDPSGKTDTTTMQYCPGPPQPATPYLSFRNATGGMMMSIPFLPGIQTVLTRKGTMWCTPSHEYRLSTGRIGQPLREVVTRKVAPVPVSAAERAAKIRQVDSLTKRFGKPEKGSLSDIPNVKPVIAGIFADEDGNVWVRRTDTPEAKPSFDVFNSTGALLATVQSPGPIGNIVFVSGNTLLTAVMDEDDLPSVVRYRVQRVAR